MSSFRLRSVPAYLGLFILLAGGMCSGQSAPQSTFFSTAAEEAYSTYQLAGDGDLWPSCWAADGDLYTANGDGTAFTAALSRDDMAVSRISGMPPNLSGTTIASDVGTNWSGPKYNRKPTGMLCIGGAIYLAFQNLRMHTFNDAPAASIAKSIDHGVTWTWDNKAPMFGKPGDRMSPDAYKFTTIFFLDYGQDSKDAIDGYVYAYGLDNNWRFQQKLYLARVPSGSILTRSAWEFYTGMDSKGTPTWSSKITQKAAVLTDTRLLYPATSRGDCRPREAVIGQGGVVYDGPLQRYIFSSWSCSTHELYEAPHPWGPWSHFLSSDFGPLKLSQNYGQYGTNIPSKFISADGKTLYLQSNVWGHTYTFALRKLYLEPYRAASATNEPSSANLALEAGARGTSKSTQFGSLCGVDCSDRMNSPVLQGSEDDYDTESKALDWWGYRWPRPYNMDRIVYETGDVFPNGGWYAGDLRVQVYRNFHWVDVAGVTVSPAYPYSKAAAAQVSYTFRFPRTSGYGVRIVGRPGGSSHFTSVSKLGVYYAGDVRER